jgi:transketolase
MAGISSVNVKLTGSHAGISIGEDGPSQMALEDLAMMRAVPDCVVLYPCEAVSTERLVARMAQHTGLVYMRTSRPKTPVLYEPSDDFRIGGSRVVRQSGGDVATVVGAGVTVFEAIKAAEALQKEGLPIRVIDAYSVQPIDAAALRDAAKATQNVVITVEDHYAAGGLGDAVSEALAPDGVAVTRLAVREIPRSGQPEELLERYGISARHIADAVRRVKTGTATVSR